jgi:valyl-tRNA synthetase
LHVLDASMRLLHPICPFQTEEIWQQLPGREVRWPGVASVCIAAWPTVEDDLVDESAETAIKLVDATVTLIRNVRQESGLSPRQPVVVDVVVKSDDARAVLLAEQGLVQRLACTDTLTITTPDGYAAPKMSAVHSDGVVEVVVHLAGLIDPAKERARLEKQIEKASKEKGGLDKRMSNAEFIASAPPDVVAKLTSDIAAVNDRVLRLQAALTRLS